MDRNARFKYNLGLGYVMQNLFGPKNHSGMAGAFGDPAFCKVCMLRAARRIRKRLDNILTMDERLRQTTDIILDRLERNVKEMSEEVNSD